ncbi:hypothetical protein C8Q70DRAFT_559527 [Cubamyces menziesii]|nr:hypothetical protein C8Q70DRAFT_559527 [Cubamyces menziesii]
MLSTHCPGASNDRQCIQTSMDSSRRSSMTSDSSSSASYVQLPGLAPVQLQKVTQPQGKTGSNYAEMLDDDNMAWGKPTKQSRRKA